MRARKPARACCILHIVSCLVVAAHCAVGLSTPHRQLSEVVNSTLGAQACPASCSNAVPCPQPILSSNGWALQYGNTLLTAEWDGITNGTGKLSLGQPGEPSFIFSSPTAVTCFLDKQVTWTDDDAVDLPLKRSVTVHADGDGVECPSMPYYGRWAADILALKLNVLYTAMLSQTTEGIAPLADAFIAETYGVSYCTCRTVGTVLGLAEQYLSGNMEFDGSAIDTPYPPYDWCAYDIADAYGSSTCESFFSQWLCAAGLTTPAAKPAPPPPRLRPPPSPRRSPSPPRFPPSPPRTPPSPRPPPNPRSPRPPPSPPDSLLPAPPSPRPPPTVRSPQPPPSPPATLARAPPSPRPPRPPPPSEPPVEPSPPRQSPPPSPRPPRPPPRVVTFSPRMPPIPPPHSPPMASPPPARPPPRNPPSPPRLPPPPKRSPPPPPRKPPSPKASPSPPPGVPLSPRRSPPPPPRQPSSPKRSPPPPPHLPASPRRSSPPRPRTPAAPRRPASPRRPSPPPPYNPGHPRRSGPPPPRPSLPRWPSWPSYSPPPPQWPSWPKSSPPPPQWPSWPKSSPPPPRWPSWPKASPPPPKGGPPPPNVPAVPKPQRSPRPSPKSYSRPLPPYWTRAPPPPPASSGNSPFPFGSCMSKNVGRAFLLSYANATLSDIGDWTYCFDVSHLYCKAARCCNIMLDHVQFLIDDFCYGALYDIKVNGQSRSAVYNVYDVKGVSYTTVKLSGMRISYEEAEGSSLCFSLNAAVCPNLASMCKGPTCALALGNDLSKGRNSCCPTQNYYIPR